MRWKVRFIQDQPHILLREWASVSLSCFRQSKAQINEHNSFFFQAVYLQKYIQNIHTYSTSMAQYSNQQHDMQTSIYRRRERLYSVHFLYTILVSVWSNPVLGDLMHTGVAVFILQWIASARDGGMMSSYSCSAHTHIMFRLYKNYIP